MLSKVTLHVMKSIFAYIFVLSYFKGVDSAKNAKIDFFLFDLEDDEVRTSPFNDTRSYGWSSTTCNFRTNMPCKFGTMEKKWSLLNGSSEKSLKDGGPDYPAIGFWSEIRDSASLLSDPITCLERNSRSVRLKLWVKGRWSFEICFLSADDGSTIGCGTSMSSTNFQIHRLEFEQPFLDHLDDEWKNQGPIIVSMNVVVDNGVILLDDISFTGSPCEYTEQLPIKWIDIKTFSTNNDRIFNELMAPILNGNFREYLRTIMSQHESNLQNIRDYGHVCDKAPCPSKSGKCFYDGTLGTVKWSLEKREYGLAYVAKFPPKILGYAILTSTGLTENPYLWSRWEFKGNFELSFNYNHEGYNFRLIVCFYSANPNNKDRCELVRKPPAKSVGNWINVIKNSIDGTYKVIKSSCSRIFCYIQERCNE